MKRLTSTQAYYYIRANGMLSRRRFQVYEVIYLYGPQTTGEIWFNHFKDMKISQNSINPRLSELVKLGVVEEIETRECSITGQICIVWGLTGNLPEKYSEPKSDKIKCPTCKGSGHIKQGRLF